MEQFYAESEKLLQFIAQSPTSFHVIKNVEEQLKSGGFLALEEHQAWNLERGKSYYVTRNSSSLIAFRIPEQSYQGFQLISSHTDSPCFKVKELPELDADKKYTKLNVEKYGGMLMAPWFDRPLSVAGRVMVWAGDRIRQVLVNIDRDLLMIPNLAIHMNRKVNEGYAYNAQVDLCPVFGDESAKDSFLKLIAEEAGVDKKQIYGMDLFLYNRQRGTFWGAGNEFIASPRLDDLQCLYGSLQGFLEADAPQNISVLCAFDNEETGSVSRQGAGSTFLVDTLSRMNEGLGGSGEDYRRLLAGSFMISADNAHAVHPNHQEMADPANRPQMNHGIVIKYNADQKYTTDAVSTAVFRRLCEYADVPYQTYANRSDMAGGSTLGNISNTQASLRCVDIGLAQLAMHSPYEMAGAKDVLYLKQVSKTFYESRIGISHEGIKIETREQESAFMDKKQNA